MLLSLAIRDLVLIEALDLDFHRGLGVLTGETGAGKSILLDALGLAMGARADSGLVRQGAERALVIAGFDVAGHAAVAALLGDNDIAQEPGEPLLIRRQVRADGGSRAFVNDQPVSAGLLRDLGVLLVEIHGQHDDRGLINPKGHRDLLDSFGRCDVAGVAAAWRGWQAAERAYADANAAIDTALRDRDLLEHNLAELTAFMPQPGEEAELAGDRAAMQKGERLSGDIADLFATFEGSKGALAQLRGAARKLDRIAEEHPLLNEALEALDRSVIEADDAEAKLRAASEALTYDSVRLDEMERRLFDLRALARKHNVAGDALPDLLARMQADWAALESGGANLTALDKARHAAKAAYVSAAEALSSERAKAGKALDAAVQGELIPLKLDAARFRTLVDPLDETRWGPSGMDHVEFLISTNPGSDFAPLMKIASGGELSRFILALKVALAEQGGAETMIFDEIDRGVGGAVASAIGERLARLALTTQLLVVTHSPQVAARGAHHLLIAKTSDGTVARTGVRLLDDADRKEEIARMLSGAEITPEARAQADRLLERV
ncbi:DNA repair protein RecN [Blastomonas fulva]|uniref:DNA repair protein RecN n=1 Tax=Blastomonas fulva TaxID=1550728 RepID=A0ABN5AZY9_9SPHN|nr:DNA repair protein RecN [Blastomonas fulva]ASR50360.1 DNA repair protein RecN [Blastomonas fulva]MDK2757928.1 DNA repair protein RecN [Blastomonas fulva]